DWGLHQHQLHARVAPVRATEYGIPVFRVASSGISQLVDRHGRTLSSAPFPGQNEIIRGTLTLQNPGSLPPDRWLAPLSSVLVLLLILVLGFLKLRGKPGHRTGQDVSDQHTSPK